MHRACTHTIQCLHLKTRDNISNEDVRGEVRSCNCMNLIQSNRSALYKKEAANSMIKGLFLLRSTISFPSICLQD